MWFKFFNKESWQMRIWRNKNLTFRYNDLGFSSHTYTSNFRNHIVRVFGHEGALRAFSLGFGVWLIMVFSYQYKKHFAEASKKKAEEKQKKIAEAEKEEYEIFMKNRFNIATNPAESIEKFAKFVCNGEVIQRLGDFNGVPEVEKFSLDFVQGLDSWVGEEDLKIMDYYKEYYAGEL